MVSHCSIRHVGLVVSDLDRSMDFYSSVFGFTVKNRMIEKGEFIEKLTGIPGAVLEWAKLNDKGGNMLELLLYHHPEPIKTEGVPVLDSRCLSHIAFTVDDIDAVCKELGRRGLKYKNEPLPSPDGRVKAMYAHDPDDYIIEIVQELFS